jgi:sugar phosphate isomerase/epimerase
MMVMRVGAKTSVQPSRLEMIRKLIGDGVVDFIEVYVTKDRVPIPVLKDACDSWVVHGPHAGHGVRFHDLTKEGSNAFKESIELASALNAKYVITHIGGAQPDKNIEKAYTRAIENVLTIKDFANQHGVGLLMENLIYNETYVVEIGLEKTPDKNFCALPQDVARVLKDVKCGFIMDFAHAIITSKNVGMDPKKILQELSDLKPVMFHVCDGHYGMEVDEHLNLGRGNYDLPFFFNIIGDRDVTLEISSDKLPVFDDFKESVEYLKNLKVLS